MTVHIFLNFKPNKMQMKSSQQNTKIEHIHSRAIVPDPVLHVGEGRLRVESSSVSDEVEWNNL